MSHYYSKTYLDVGGVDAYTGGMKVIKGQYQASSDLSNGDVISMVRLPATAIVLDIDIHAEASATGTKNFTVRYGKVSDNGTTHSDIKTSTGDLTSAVYWNMKAESAASGTRVIEPGYEFSLDIELSGANGYGQDKNLEMFVTYFTPTFDAEANDYEDGITLL